MFSMLPRLSHRAATWMMALTLSAAWTSHGRADGELMVEPRAVAPHAAQSPAVAFGKTRSIVVWSRDGKTLFQPMRADGSLLDVDGIPLFDEEGPVSVAWVDDAFWVAHANSAASNIEVARISEEAVILSRLVVSTPGLQPAQPPQLAPGDDDVLLLYAGQRSADMRWTIQAVRLSRELKVVDTDPLVLPTQGKTFYDIFGVTPPTAVWNHDRWLVGWVEGDEGSEFPGAAVLGSITADGVASNTPQVLGPIDSPLLISKSGGTVGVFWYKPARNGTAPVVLRFSETNVQLDPEPVSPPVGWRCFSALVPVDGGWQVFEGESEPESLAQYRDTFLQAGFVGEPPLTGGRCYESLRDSAAAKDGAIVMAIEREVQFGHTDVDDPDGDAGPFIEMVRVFNRPAGAQSVTHVLSSAKSPQLYPTVTGAGDRWFVAWQEFDHHDSYVVYGAIVYPDGTITSTATSHLSPGGTGGGERPSVGWNGSHFLLAWNSFFEGDDEWSSPAHKVEGMLYDVEGRALLAAPVSLTEGHTKVIPRVSVTDGRFSVYASEQPSGRAVWVDVLASGALRVTPGGKSDGDAPCAVAGKMLEVTTNPGPERYPSSGVTGTSRVIMRIVDAPEGAADCALVKAYTPIEQPDSPVEPTPSDPTVPTAPKPEAPMKTATKPARSHGGCAIDQGMSGGAPWSSVVGLFVGWLLGRNRRRRFCP